MGITFNCTQQPDRLLQWGAKKIGPVFITARSLFLNENVSVHAANDSSGNTAWNFGTYAKDLKLDDATLNAWAGKKVLDVGAGASLFPEEAGQAYSIDVTTLDLNVGGNAPYLDTLSIPIDASRQTTLGLAHHVDRLNGKGYLRQLYTRNLEWLWCHYQASITTEAALFPAFQKIFNKRFSISQGLFNNTNKRVQGNANDPTKFAKDSFDVLMSVWVFNYLDTATKKKIIENMVYWAKPPAEIRIHGGRNNAEGSTQDYDLTPANFRWMFSWTRFDWYAQETRLGQMAWPWQVQIHGRKVTVDTRSDDTCLILQVTKP